jgi:hypothetical protein
MRSSHSLDRLATSFDDDRLVADAGLLLPATLAAHLGLKGLVEERMKRINEMVLEADRLQHALGGWCFSRAGETSGRHPRPAPPAT